MCCRNRRAFPRSIRDRQPFRFLRTCAQYLRHIRDGPVSRDDTSRKPGRVRGSPLIEEIQKNVSGRTLIQPAFYYPSKEVSRARRSLRTGQRSQGPAPRTNCAWLDEEDVSDAVADLRRHSHKLGEISSHYGDGKWGKYSGKLGTTILVMRSRTCRSISPVLGRAVTGSWPRIRPRKMFKCASNAKPSKANCSTGSMSQAH